MAKVLDGVGPEIAAILIQDRERTASTAVGLIDRMEAQIKRLTKERDHYRQVAFAFMDAEEARREAHLLSLNPPLFD